MQHAALFALLIAITLQGCGYKGPLHLPTEEPAKPADAGQPKTTQPQTTQPVNQQDNKQ